MKTFKEVYQFPFENSQWGWVYDFGGENFIFQWQFDDDDKEKRLLSVINAEENLKHTKPIFYHKEGCIFYENEEIILIRGWGNLTSPNCFGFSPEEAANIQDTLAEYIVERLNYRE